VNIQAEDFSSFRSWIKLNLEGITWQGRFTQDFEDFWKLFFIDGITLDQISNRFLYAKSQIKIGPLSSWFEWLQEKFLCYIFINKEMTIKELSNAAHIDLQNLATTLRNYFVDIFPHLEEEVNDIFQISNSINVNADYTFNDVKKILGVEGEFPRGFDDDLMCSLEVTLYEDWKIFLNRLREEYSSVDKSFNVVKTKQNIKSVLFLALEASLVIAVCAAIIMGVKVANQRYSESLLNQISIYEPKFDWLKKDLVFRSKTTENLDDFRLNLEDLEEELEKNDNIVIPEEVRDGAESEVTLTSWESLPKDFDVADLESSEYEEQLKKGYRDSRYGNTKVYRVIMKTVDTDMVKSKLNDLLLKYKVTQVDHVRPGQEVPGGIYYNLYVPREFLQEFIEQVKSVDSSISYESRTRSKRNPPGKNKVFIWVKRY
jgi:hypothetical protein